MSALVIITSIGTKPHFKQEAVRGTAGIGTREWQRTGAPICVWHRAPQELNPALGKLPMLNSKWEDYRIGPPPKSTLICFNSTQKGLGLVLGWRSDSVVFPGLTWPAIPGIRKD